MIGRKAGSVAFRPLARTRAVAHDVAAGMLPLLFGDAKKMLDEVLAALKA